MKRELIVRKHDNSTIEAIRVTVDKMVQEVGFDEMTIRGICSEVGITVGTFYHYFTSKNDLLLDRYVRYMEFFEELYKGLLELNEIDALKLLITKHIEYGLSRVYKIHKRYFQIMMDDYERWATVKQNSVEDIFEKIITNGQEKGTISKQYTPHTITLFLLSIVNGVSIQYFTSQPSILEDKNLINLVFDYIDTLKLN